MSLNDNISFQSVDSTLQYDKPNSNWTDIYNQDKIVKRTLGGSTWSKNFYTFEYNQERIEKIIKHASGFESTMEFQYANNQLFKIVDNQKYFGKTEYLVSRKDEKYNLQSQEGVELEIDPTLLGLCGGINYGQIEILDFMLNLNTTNSTKNPRSSEQLEIWPNTDLFSISCIKDKCNNTTIYAKQSNETKTIIELYQLNYYYKRKTHDNK